MSSFVSNQVMVPPFISIEKIDALAGEVSYTISNEVSGRHFKANLATVNFLENLRRNRSVDLALRQAGINSADKHALMDQLFRFGVLVEQGSTRSDTGKPKTPLESRAIMLRFDLIDAAHLTNKLSWLGRLLYSRLGFVLWLGAILFSLSAFLQNQDKARIAVRQIPETGLLQAALFIMVFLALKAVHEMGHALAYQRMCKSQGLQAGPIRMGISIFAMTPFPYTDVSGAWRLKGRLSRALIGAGGLYFEFWLVAFLTLFWANTSVGPFQSVIFQVAMFSILSSLLFNLNPAVKLDGYYIFSDLLGQPNIAGKASLSARSTFARLLGAKAPAPSQWALFYWGISYLYRWTIFAGIFWAAYQLDPRLAGPAMGIVVMLLVVRPLVATISFTKEREPRPMRIAMSVICILALVGALFVPFRDRVLMTGQFARFDNAFLRGTEVARLVTGPTGLPLFESDDLEYERKDLEIRIQMSANALRAVSLSGLEQAKLEADLERLTEMLAETNIKMEQMSPTIPETAVWTALASRQLAQSWTRPADNRDLGALSTPTEPFLILWLDQTAFEEGLLSDVNQSLDIRFGYDAKCQFRASLNEDADQLAIQNGVLQLRARPEMPLPPCARDIRSGAEIVARLPARPKSIAGRFRQLASRTLQDRLPLEKLTQSPQTQR